MTVPSFNLKIMPTSDEKPSERQPSSLTSSEGCLKQQKNLLTFKRPEHLAPINPIPPTTASLPDKLQWLAIERPNVLRVVDRLVEGVMSKCRQPIALRVELTDRLEYRAVTYTDPSILIAPPDVCRIGRQIRDVVAPDYAQLIERAVHRARATGVDQIYTYTLPHSGVLLRGVVHIKKRDLIVIDISKEV